MNRWIQYFEFCLDIVGIMDADARLFGHSSDVNIFYGNDKIILNTWDLEFAYQNSRVLKFPCEFSSMNTCILPF